MRTTAAGTASPHIPWMELTVLLHVSQLMASPKCQSLLELTWMCNMNARHRQQVPCQATLGKLTSEPSCLVFAHSREHPSLLGSMHSSGPVAIMACCNFSAPQQSSRGTQSASLLHRPPPHAQLPGLKAISQLKGLHFFKSLL